MGNQVLLTFFYKRIHKYRVMLREKKKFEFALLFIMKHTIIY